MNKLSLVGMQQLKQSCMTELLLGRILVIDVRNTVFE